MTISISNFVDLYHMKHLKKIFAPSILLLDYPLSSTNLWLIFLKDRTMKYLVFFIISLPVTTHGKCLICSRLAIKRR